MTGRRGWRLAAKVLHEIASMAYGGALAACLVINATADRRSPDAFAAARRAFAATAQYVLVPSMAVVVVSGLLAMIATRGYLDAGWAWIKAALGLTVLEATLMVVGSSARQSAMTAAAVDAAVLDPLLRSERNTLWLLVAISALNVVLAVWRPRVGIKVR